MHSTEPGTGLRIGHVVLAVRDLERVMAFYEETVGLRVLHRDGTLAQLGAGSSVLLELHHDAGARPALPHEAGLFHTAFLLPDRADLARWALHAAESRVAISGASDHRVSEAFYLEDPEGNGVEITADWPRETWRWDGAAVAMATRPLDLASLVADAGPTSWDGAPDGTTIGHVHLKVGAIEAAEGFYAGVLGLPLTARYPGGSFFGADRYHHHLAANVWHSRDAGPRPEATTGVREIVLSVPGTAFIDGVGRRAAAAGVTTTRRGTALSLDDPWGTRLSLSGAAS